MPMRPYDSCNQFRIPKVSQKSLEETTVVRERTLEVSFWLVRNPVFAKSATLGALELARRKISTEQIDVC